MTLEEAIQRAAGDLPDGWDLSIWVERGAGTIELYDDSGEAVNFEPSPDLSMAEQIDAMVSHAIALANIE